MAKRKKCKRTNNDLQNIHIKLKIEQHETIVIIINKCLYELIIILLDSIIFTSNYTIQDSVNYDYISLN